jgi:transposase-like protein
MLELGTLAFAAIGGWAWWTTADMPEPDGVALRFAERPGADGAPARLEAVDVVVHAERSGLTGQMLRTLPLARLQAAVNRPGLADQVRQRIRAADRPIDLAAFVPTEIRADQPEMLGSSPEDRTSDAPLGVLDQQILDRAWSVDPKIVAPAGSRKPDAFYELVAERFALLAATGHRPAAAIAEASGVPATTVHRWVREARRRGLLPAGERSAVQRPSRASGI